MSLMTILDFARSVRTLSSACKTAPRVLIDATCVTREKAGVGVYALNLIRELASDNDSIDIYVLIQDDDPEMCIPGTISVRIPSRLGRNLPIRITCEQLVMPLLLAALKIDLLHSLHYSFPILRFGNRQVVTIHDMTSFIMPEVHLRLKVNYFRTFIRLAARAADHLVFDSKSACSDFASMFGPKLPPLTVSHLGKEDRFHPQIPKNDVCAIRQKYSLPEKYVLYLGTIEPRKNLVRLVQAFQSIALKHPDVCLIISGKKGWMSDDLFTLAASQGLESRILFTGFVSEKEKPALIAGALVFAYPTLYEGFGIPALEALACGVPVLTSRISSIPEVVGDAAVLIDPYRVEEIGEGLDRLLSDNPLRLHLSEAGLQQSSKFTWRKTAQTTRAAYEQCLQQGKHLKDPQGLPAE